jgi:choline dehydrogenase-like flavoprotein
MFIDLRNLDDNTVLEADICIVGAGPAGISMARSLIGTSIDVLMIESGDLEFDDATQALYQGDSVGTPYFGLDESRLRFFGGSSNHWDNWCGEFQPIDFQARSWVPYSGWPFGPSELEPWYDLARPICSLGPRRKNGACRTVRQVPVIGRYRKLGQGRRKIRVSQYTRALNWGIGSKNCAKTENTWLRRS